MPKVNPTTHIPVENYYNPKTHRPTRVRPNNVQVLFMGHSVHCVAKTSTLYYNTMYSLNSLSEISTHLNDDWCAESRRNFSSLISILSTTPEQCCLCTLRTADLTYLTEVDPWRSQECELGAHLHC